MNVLTIEWGDECLVQLGNNGVSGTIALVLDFPAWAVTATIVLLVVSFVVLPLPIVFGYGVRDDETVSSASPMFRLPAWSTPSVLSRRVKVF